MSATETFHIPLEAAEVYESRFVPGIFAEWAPLLIDIAQVRPEQTVLDVACGTGIVARTVADQVGPNGRVVGVDLNEAMLTVARRVRPDIEWRQGDAGSLPFTDESYDMVLCQMSLMFFSDRATALGEMARVATTDGTIAVAVPGALATQPAYGPFVDMASQHAGHEAQSLLSTYFACGDIDELHTLIQAAGLRALRSRTHMGTARFDSVDDFVATEVEGSPLIERINADVYERIRAGARKVLRPYTTTSGAVEVPLEGHLVTARKG